MGQVPHPGIYHRCVRRLYLLRHAKSSWDDPALDDRERPLAPRGRRAADRLAAYVERERIRPALVLCSPARRTWETLERVLPDPPSSIRIEADDDLYLAGADDLLERVRRVPDDAESLLLVGHNPGIEDLLHLLGGPAAVRRIGEKLPTGALATLEHDGSWSTLRHCRLMDYVTPRQLR
jgi:phosphohistidine phosphatase